MKALYWTVIASTILLASTVSRADDCRPGRGRDMMGQGMMGQGMMSQGMMGPGMMGPGMMSQKAGLHLMMILMDTDGDGTLSLDEIQSAHAKIFKAIDADKNGKITLEEMQQFFAGGPPATP